MPTLQSMELSRPSDWQEFERIVKHYASIKWPNHSIAFNGGNGQTQHGVDLYVKNNKEEFIGIQCKLASELPIKIVEKEVEKARQFKPELKYYYIATTAKRNAKTQEKVNLLSQQRVAIGLFNVEVLFWEDIAALLLTAPNILEQLYPQLFYSADERGLVNVAHNEGIIATGHVVNVYHSKSPSTKSINRYIDGTVGSDRYQKGYVRHLIDRYHQFKLAEFTSKKEMNYSIIYQSIKREIKYKWDETPFEHFEKLCAYIQKRIDSTILGKQNKKKGIKNYSSFDEFRA